MQTLQYAKLHSKVTDARLKFKLDCLSKCDKLS